MPQLPWVVWAGLLLTVGMGSPYSSAQEFSGKLVGVAPSATVTLLGDRTQARVLPNELDCPEARASWI
jgi:hypothetical protein